MLLTVDGRFRLAEGEADMLRAMCSAPIDRMIIGKMFQQETETLLSRLVASDSSDIVEGAVLRGQMKALKSFHERMFRTAGVSLEPPTEQE